MAILSYVIALSLLFAMLCHCEGVARGNLIIIDYFIVSLLIMTARDRGKARNFSIYEAKRGVIFDKSIAFMQKQDNQSIFSMKI